MKRFVVYAATSIAAFPAAFLFAAVVTDVTTQCVFALAYTVAASAAIWFVE